MKKLASFILSTFLFISTLAVFPASAKTNFSISGDFAYSLSGDEACIEDYNGKSDKIIYPSEIDGHKVTKINGSPHESQEIKEIYIPDSVTEIKSGCYFWYRNLEKVRLSSSLKEIDIQTFEGCSSLKKIVIPSGVKTIGEGAFRDCYKLSVVQLPDSLENIQQSAFYNTAIKSVNIPKNVKKIDQFCWCDCDDQGDTGIGGAFGGAPVREFSVDRENKTYSSKSGVLYNKNQTRLYCYPPKKAAEKFTVPNTVTKINKNAFWGCRKLKSVIISSKVKTIGNCAFKGCRQLSSVKFKTNKISVIPYGCFSSCVSMKSIKIPAKVRKIDHDAFYNCEKLSNLKIASKKSLKILSGAFTSCDSLKSVYIPKNVKKIGQYAFGYSKHPETCCSSTHYTKHKNFTIKGAKNSVAHKYAKKNKFEFVIK